jgi:hypothetical protein
VNPISVISGIASILGIGSSLVSQGVIVHRELHPPQVQAQVQQQQCVPPGKLEVVMLANGQRQLVCVEESQNAK